MWWFRRGGAADRAVISLEQVSFGYDGHPTLSEAIHEAALAADKHAIHAINR